MIRRILTNESLNDLKVLHTKCTDVSPGEDVSGVLQDLKDTAEQYFDNCLGLAANQVGSLKRVFVLRRGSTHIPIINPKVIGCNAGVKAADESCLSLPGMPPQRVRRHKEVILQYSTEDCMPPQTVTETFSGLEARVVQHEMDHLRGVLV